MSAQIPIPKCKAPGCGKKLPPHSGVGRIQEYCDTKCRMAAWRARHAQGFETGGPVATKRTAPADPVEAVAIGKPGPTDEQAAIAIIEARNLIASMRRLSREARPELAWRFAKASKGLTEILAELFGDVDD